MNEFKGTKGNWSAIRHIHENSGDYLIISETEYQVAIADNAYINDYEETNANALLISKAPEMLDMLGTVVKRLKGNGFPRLQSEIERLIKEATEI